MNKEGTSEKSKILGLSPGSPVRIKTYQERQSRESDELCKIHQAPIIAFDEKTGVLYCEKCVYEGLAERPLFMATVARKLIETYNTQYDEF